MDDKSLILNIEDIVLLKQYPNMFIKKYDVTVTKSYSHKPHLQGLPYDRNSRNIDKISARYIACQKQEEKLLKEIKELKDIDLKKELEEYKKAKDTSDKLEEDVSKAEHYNEKFKELDKEAYDEKREILDNLIDRDEMFGLVRDEVRAKIDYLKWTLMKSGYTYGRSEELITQTQKDIQEYIDDASNMTPEEYSLKYTGFADYFDGDDLEEAKDLYESMNADLEKIKTNSRELEIAQRNSVPDYEVDKMKKELKTAKSETKKHENTLKKAKDTLHKKTTELYDYVDEGMNCVDLFKDATGGMYANTSKVQDIEAYISDTGLKNQLNSDGTVKESWMEESRRTWADSTDEPFPE